MARFTQYDGKIVSHGSVYMLIAVVNETNCACLSVRMTVNVTRSILTSLKTFLVQLEVNKHILAACA